MFIVNLIAQEENEYIEPILRIYAESGLYVAYTDNLSTGKYAVLANELKLSVVHAIDRLPYQRLVYEMAWDHLDAAGVSNQDWVLTLHIDETLAGLENVVPRLDSFEQVGLINVMAYDNNGEPYSTLQPRLFKFEKFGCDFHSGNCWPSYVDYLAKRQYNTFTVEEFSIMKLYLNKTHFV